MAEAKVTRKELFGRIAEVMAEDAEVVAMCEKYIEQLSRPRKRKVNEAAIEFAEKVYGVMGDEPMTNKEVRAAINAELPEDEAVSAQKVAAALRRLEGDGKVTSAEGEGKSDPKTYTRN